MRDCPIKPTITNRVDFCGTFQKLRCKIEPCPLIGVCSLGEFTPSYILHTRAFGTYLLGGGIYLEGALEEWVTFFKIVFDIIDYK
jgi:hypothetical protein